MTRIPTATRRQRVEVRASQTGPTLPSLHALARHVLPRFNAGTAKQCRAWLSPNRIERIPFQRLAEGFPPGPERPGFHPWRNPMRNRVRAFPLEIVSGAVALVMVLSALAVLRLRWQEPVMVPIVPILLMVGVFFIAIVIGEVFRVREPGTRHTAPLATAAALAFAMTVACPHGTPAAYRAPVVVAVTAIGMAIGLTPSL